MDDSATTDPTDALRSLLEREREFRENLDGSDEYPETGPERGSKKVERWRTYLDDLGEIDRSALPTGDRVDYDVLERELEYRITNYEHGTHLRPVDHESGPTRRSCGSPRTVRSTGSTTTRTTSRDWRRHPSTSTGSSN